MKNNYLLVLFVFITSVASAQFNTIYETDFSTLNNGQNILLEKDADEIIWTGANQIWQNFTKREGGLQTESNWRGAHLSGKPVGAWAAGKSVKVTTEIIITDASIFDEELIFNDAETNRDLMFGITERQDHSSGDTDRGDAPSYGGAVSIGFEIRDLYTTTGEMQIRLANLTNQLFVISAIANGDIIRFEYTATKMAEANTFSVMLDIIRNESKVSTLSGTFQQEIIYNASPEITVFNAYCKIPYNAGGVSNGTDENDGLLWTSMKLEMGDTPTNVVDLDVIQSNVYVSNGVLYINNTDNTPYYEIYDIRGSLVKSDFLLETLTQVPLNLNKGIYLVKLGNSTTKVVL